MKIGLDVHGVLDTHTNVFATIAKALVADGHEVHIITGPSKAHAMKDLATLDIKEGVHYTHFCSIIDYRASQGVTVTWDDRGHGWLRSELWDSAKAEYCSENGVHIHIDDSEVYGKHFTQGIYLQLKGDRNAKI